MTVDVAPILTPDEAERLTLRIASKLDTIANNYQDVMPLIRQAVEQNAATALGYSGVSAYVSDRFGGALKRLGVETRREVVRELTASGMSTRAAAEIVGVDQSTVVRDLKATDADASVERPARVTGLDGRERPATQPERPQPEPIKVTETHRSEIKTETAIDPLTGEVLAEKPAPSAAEFLASDPTVQRSEFLMRLHQSLNKAMHPLRFQPDELGPVIDNDDMAAIDHAIEALTHWRNAVVAARPRHLRSVL